MGSSDELPVVCFGKTDDSHLYEFPMPAGSRFSLSRWKKSRKLRFLHGSLSADFRLVSNRFSDLLAIKRVPF